MYKTPVITSVQFKIEEFKNPTPKKETKCILWSFTSTHGDEMSL